MSDELPELPEWLADQVDALARDEAAAVQGAWQRIERHVPADVIAALPDDVLIGTGPNRGAFRFLDPGTGGTVAEVRDRPDDGAATVMKLGEVALYRLGAFVGRIELPRTPPPEDPASN